MIINGDCLTEMQKMEANSIDFIVTDPPYGLHFMGKDWDSSTPNVEIWKEALRICKPGAMLASFGGSRTHHHLMIALEHAGWEIRDTIMWIYGSGFPKSHNFGRKLGGEWSGYGTSLKPAYEPIILCQKPLDGTFAQNAEKWGVGGVNIDGSRLPTEDDRSRTNHKAPGFSGGYGVKNTENNSLGRWPANLILDEKAAEELGNPSRFFYCAKASSSERNAGLEGMPLKQTVAGGGLNNTPDNVCGKYGSIKAPQQNNHPTVKPLSLMRYIIKLLAPPGNSRLLDPFAGSGSTLVAAQQLGINAIGIEKSEEYCDIATRRLESA